MATDERTKDILDFYTRARAAADEAIESLDIDATGTAFAFFDGATVSLRWALSFFELATDQVTAHESQRARPPGC